MRVAHALAAVLLGAAAPALASDGSRPSRITAAEANRQEVIGLFAAPLAEHGEWMRLADGRVAWRPGGVVDGWRPYVDGSWEWTEEGWYWVSEEPWAWATYHFGRWRLDSRLGWTWLPGADWAPAWVVWRVGAEVVGWAPRPDDGGTVLPADWTFLPASRFAARATRGAALHPTRVPALLLRSRRVEDGWAGPARPRTAPPAPRALDAIAPAPIPSGAPPVTARRAAR